jgi:DNA-binding HxlR family transcriptional regulator
MTEHEIRSAETLRAETVDSPRARVVSETNETSASCAQFQRAIEFIGRRWNGAILFALLNGPCRFNELLAKVPNLSDRLLTERLRELEAAGLLTRAVHPGPPVRVVYELTQAGHDLSDIVHGIMAWAHKWMPESAE